MKAKILTSTPIIESEFKKFKEICDKMSIDSHAPKMAVILVGDDPASKVYVKNKEKFCRQIGADFLKVQLEKNISKEEFLNTVQQISGDSSIDGLIVQLPVPQQLKDINFGKIIPANKDLDGFNLENINKIYNGDNSGICPCTPKGIIKLLDYYKIPIEAQKVAIIGRGMLVGRPLSLMLTNRNATVTLCHSKSNLEKEINQADIIVTAAGCCQLINPTQLKPTKLPVIIDVGINIENGKIKGDCDYRQLEHLCRAITPVPKGIGPMTIWGLLDNLITLSTARRKDE